MDSKKIGAIVVAVVVIAAAAGGLWYYNNNKDKGETVSIAYLNLGYYPFMVGFHDGWFDDLPFNVEPVVVNGSGQDAVNAVLAGEATMAATGDAPFVNTMGKYPDEIIGLTQYTQGSGSLSGHRWIAEKSEMSSLLDSIEVENNTSTNSQTVANQIRSITDSGLGGTDGMFTVALVDGSTTETNFKKWCLEYGLTYVEGDEQNPDADLRIVGLLNVDAAVLTTALETPEVDALAINNSYYQQLSNDKDVGPGIYVWGDSSSLMEVSYSVFCTTAANYEKYYDEMMQILEVLKDICDWIKANPAEAAAICASLVSDESAEEIEDSIRSTSYSVTWNVSTDSDSYASWISTAKVNGYTITQQQFIQACPHRDIINSWYSDTSAAS